MPRRDHRTMPNSHPSTSIPLCHVTTVPAGGRQLHRSRTSAAIMMPSWPSQSGQACISVGARCMGGVWNHDLIVFIVETPVPPECPTASVLHFTSRPR